MHIKWEANQIHICIYRKHKVSIYTYIPFQRTIYNLRKLYRNTRKRLKSKQDVPSHRPHAMRVKRYTKAGTFLIVWKIQSVHINVKKNSPAQKSWIFSSPRQKSSCYQWLLPPSQKILKFGIFDNGISSTISLKSTKKLYTINCVYININKNYNL